MNQDLTQKIQDILGGQLSSPNSKLPPEVEVVSIPLHGDRMVRLKTLEGILEEFEAQSAGTGSNAGYFVHVRPHQPHPERAQQRAPQEGVYLSSGKLNNSFLFKNADLLFAAGDYPLARNIYKSILQSGESTGQALFGVARCLESEGKLDEARLQYEEAIAYHPSLESYRRLASILMQQGREQNAAEILQRALNLKDLSIETRFELHHACGNCWSRAKRIAEAESHYQKALGLNPSADEVRTNLGALYLQLGRTAEAKRHFQDALASNSRNDKSLVGLGSCLMNEGDKRQAHDYFVRALDVEIHNPSAIFFLVKCAYELKSYATAARILENYIEVAPINTPLLYSLAGLQFHLSRLDSVRGTIDRIFQLDPNHSGAKELLGLING